MSDLGAIRETTVRRASDGKRPADGVVRFVGFDRFAQLPGVGICGSRNANERSLVVASDFGKIVADLGMVVVSGNAKGVDDAAQRGALEAGGTVTAVLAEGLGHWKPRVDYRDRISKLNFAAVTEFADDASWQMHRAMQRNKLIIDLSVALVVVQAGTKGGTWEAGLACLKRSKPLFVVEWSEDSPETEGNRELIARGGIGIRTRARLREFLQVLRDGGTLPSDLQGQLL